MSAVYVGRLRSRLLKGGLWVGFGLAGNLVATVGLTMILARLVSPAELGTYFLAFSAITILGTVSQLGLNKSVVRFVAEQIAASKLGEAKRTIYSVFQLGMLSTVSLAAIILDCPSSNRWDRCLVLLRECFAHHFHVRQRAVDSANDVSRWSFV